MKISTPRMVLKFARLFIWRVLKRGWYLPNVPEITVDELFEHLNSDINPLILDLRDRADFEGNGKQKTDRDGHIESAKWIPIMKLPALLDELLPSYKDHEIVTICPGGGMSLVAVELLTKAGFQDAKSLKGGIWAWAKKGYPLNKSSEPATAFHEELGLSDQEDQVITVNEPQPLDSAFTGEVHKSVDARNLLCPRPILMSKKELKKLKVGQVLEIFTTDPGSVTDIPAWIHVTNQELLVSEERGPKDFRFLVRKQS